MKGIEIILGKKNFNKKPKVKVKFQFQEIALELAEEFNLKGKDVSILFGFLKRQMAKGMWWKIKEVREYMANKNIKSLRYFMACFKNKDNNK